MTTKIRKLLISVTSLASLLLFTSCLLSCKDKPKEYNRKGFHSYSEATEWVKENYEEETINPSSSIIHKLVYFAEGEFMLIHFNSNKEKGYLYHHVSESLWFEFKHASNIDSFYESRIKGNKSIYLRLKK